LAWTERKAFHLSDNQSTLRCWAEINLSALRHNVGVVRGMVGESARIMAVVKANAYGHGLRGIVQGLAGHVDMFGVANIGEAQLVRDSAPEARVFIMGPALSGEREAIVRGGWIPAVSSVEEAAAFAKISTGAKIPVHLAIDTGMGRMGVWQEEALEVAKKIAALHQIELAGIATHLPVADEDEAFTQRQLDYFEKIIFKLRAAGIKAPLVHSLNSAGVIQFSLYARDMVRVGLMLYGSSPIPGFQDRLRPVMTLKTRVALVHDVGAGRGISYGRTFITKTPMRIATLAVGYGDGYPRHLSNQDARVLIRGHRCPVLGRVTMDQIMVDVTDLNALDAGEEVVLIGRQGSGEISAAEVAQKAGTIAWEIFTGISSRVERVYLT
jgi:alanine racemase